MNHKIFLDLCWCPLHDHWDVTSTYFGGSCQRFAMWKFCLWFFLVTVVDQMVLGPLNFPAKVHCTTIFALRSGMFSRLGRGWLTQYPLLSFHPCMILIASCKINAKQHFLIYSCLLLHSFYACTCYINSVCLDSNRNYRPIPMAILHKVFIQGLKKNKRVFSYKVLYLRLCKSWVTIPNIRPFHE